MSRLAAALCAVVAAWAMPANATPTVTNFTPTSGAPGAAVTINGSGFTGASVVKFAAATATFQVKSDAKILATVPATAATGVISVTAGGSTVHSTTKFTVLPGAGVSPRSGHPLLKITVSGTGFDPASTVDVFFGTTDLALAVTDGSGKFSMPLQIPSWAQPGTNWITLMERNTTHSAQSTFKVTTPWLMAGYDAAGDGANPYENTVATWNVGSLSLSQSLYAGSTGNLAPFVISNNRFIAMYTGTILAYSPAGTLLWSGATANANFHAMAPVADAARVYLGDDNGDVSAFSATCHSNGTACTPLWTANVGTNPGGLTLYKGTLYVSSSDGSVHTLNPATGAEGTPFYVDDTTHGAVVSPIAIQNGNFYYVTFDGMHAYLNEQLLSGLRWYGNYGAPSMSGLALYSGDAFFTTSDGMAHRNGSSSGWDTQLSTTGTGCWIRPVVTGTAVFAADCDTIAALNPVTGQVRWSATGYNAGLAFANGVLYVCGNAGGGFASILMARDANSGALLWSGGACHTAPEVSDGTVYTSAAGLYAYTLPGFGPAPIAAARPDPPTLKRNYKLKPQAVRSR